MEVLEALGFRRVESSRVGLFLPAELFVVAAIERALLSVVWSAKGRSWAKK